MNCRTILGLVCLVGLLVVVPLSVHAADPPVIRFGHGFAAEEQVWLMAARPDLAPRTLALEGLAQAEALKHSAAAVYFRMLVANVDIREGRNRAARDVFLSVQQELFRLAGQDPEYQGRLRMASQNASALSRMLGE